MLPKKMITFCLNVSGVRLEKPHGAIFRYTPWSFHWVSLGFIVEVILLMNSQAKSTHCLTFNVSTLVNHDKAAPVKLLENIWTSSLPYWGMTELYSLRSVYGHPFLSYFSNSRYLNFDGNLRLGWISHWSWCCPKNLCLSFDFSCFSSFFTISFVSLSTTVDIYSSYCGVSTFTGMGWLQDMKLDWGVWNTLYVGVNAFCLRKVFSRTRIMDNERGRIDFEPSRHCYHHLGEPLWVHPLNCWTWTLK